MHLLSPGNPLKFKAFCHGGEEEKSIIGVILLFLKLRHPCASSTKLSATNSGRVSASRPEMSFDRLPHRQSYAFLIGEQCAEARKVGCGKVGHQFPLFYSSARSDCASPSAGNCGTLLAEVTSYVTMSALMTKVSSPNRFVRSRRDLTGDGRQDMRPRGVGSRIASSMSHTAARSRQAVPSALRQPVPPARPGKACRGVACGHLVPNHERCVTGFQDRRRGAPNQAGVEVTPTLSDGKRAQVRSCLSTRWPAHTQAGAGRGPR